MTRVKRFNVVIATDGFPAAKAAVATALQFPWPNGSHAFAGSRSRHVPTTDGRFSSRRSIGRPNSSPQGAARAVSRRWPDAEVHVVEALPVDAIVWEAARRRAGAVTGLSGGCSRGVCLVVRRAPCAVLVVKRALRDVRHMVIGFDDSAHARRAVELISSLSPPRGGRVSLFTAVDTMHVPSQALVLPDTRAAVSAEVTRINKERLARAHQAFDRAARTFTRAGWKGDRVVTTGAPLRDLLATVAKKGADLVVVGAKGVTGVPPCCSGVSRKAR